MNKRYLLPVLLVSSMMATTVQAQTVDVELQLPAINSSQYKRPYVAVWVERKGERRALTTLAVWHEDKKWLKDIRRWWRNAGRYNADVDGVTGATRAPGTYKLSWDGKGRNGETLSGEFLLCLEAVREHGNRSLIKQKFRFGDGAQTYTIAAGDELGPVTVKVGE